MVLGKGTEGMHVISRKVLQEFCKKHADACEALYEWYRVSSKAEWQNLIDVQAIYPKSEAVGKFTVFNIKGNQYRLIVDIVYPSQRIYIKYVLTHAEYDKDRWKNDPYF
jgi:mRNA interferase HigB